MHVKGSLIPANSNESGGDEEGVSSYPGPAYRGVPGTGRLARRSYYTDSAYIPYIHPRFVMEQDFPPEGEDETILPPQSKRATKGMCKWGLRKLLEIMILNSCKWFRRVEIKFVGYFIVLQ